MTRETWTDERLDDLAAGMHREFGELRADIRALHVKVDNQGAELRDEIGGVRGEIGGVRGEIAALRRTIVIGCISISASIVGSAVAVMLQGSP